MTHHTGPTNLEAAEVAALERLLLRRVPFTTRVALAEGANYVWLRRWTRAGLLRHPVRGVYHAPDLTDDLALRVAILRLVVPPECVVTDRTAGWLWGADMILAPGDHVVTPAVSVFSPPGHRLRNGLVDGGERRLTPQDVAELDGLRVTVPLRTACDLGRLLQRDQALAAMDSISRLRRYTPGQLAAATLRFRGYRGVIQLRALVGLVDPRSESPGESILRLRWYDAGLPRPQCQVPVPSPNGSRYFIDIGLPGKLLGAEYDGEEFHGADQRAYDDERRRWLRQEFGWVIVVARRDNVHGRQQDAELLLRRAWESLK